MKYIQLRTQLYLELQVKCQSMEFETVDYTDEMVIVEKKNNGNKNKQKGAKKERRQLKLTTHSYNVIYIYLYVNYIYIYTYIYIYIKYNTSVVFTRQLRAFPSVALESL